MYFKRHYGLKRMVLLVSNEVQYDNNNTEREKQGIMEGTLQAKERGQTQQPEILSIMEYE